MDYLNYTCSLPGTKDSFLQQLKSAVCTGAVNGDLKNCYDALTDYNLHKLRNDITIIAHDLTVDQQTQIANEPIHVAGGLAHVIAGWGAALGCTGFETFKTNYELAKAIELFDVAWTLPVLPPLATETFRSAVDALREHDVSSAVKEIVAQRRTQPTGGLFVVLDLIADLCVLANVDNMGMANSSVERTQSTIPILFAADDTRLISGTTGLLVVELIKGYGTKACVPNPLELGLTMVNVPNTSFLSQSMEAAWGYSGLSDKFRMRWWITNLRVESDLRIQYTTTTSIGGPSAQAAALIAYWAAAGSIPYENPFTIDTFTTFPLVPTVAVSAMLNRGDCTGSLTDRKLQKVGGVSQKLAIAKATGLEVILATDEDDSEPEKQAKAAEDLPREEGTPYLGWTPPIRLQTIGDACDWALQCNRWMKAWADHHAEAWLKEWDVLRDEQNNPIPITIGEGPSRRQIPLVNTGSLEYMRHVSASPPTDDSNE